MVFRSDFFDALKCAKEIIMLCTEQKSYYESDEFSELCRKNFEKYYGNWDEYHNSCSETVPALAELINPDLADLKKELMGELMGELMEEFMPLMKESKDLAAEDHDAKDLAGKFKKVVEDHLIGRVRKIANQVFDERSKTAATDAVEEAKTVADGLAETKCSSNQMEEAFKKASSKRARK